MKFEGANGIEIDATEDVGLNVNITDNIINAGKAIGSTQIDNSSNLYRNSFYVTSNGRLKVGANTPLLSENFMTTNTNTSIWKYQSQTTMAAASITSALIINSGSITTTNTNVTIGTSTSYNIYGGGGLTTEMILGFTQSFQANNSCEWGMFYASGASTPTTGAYFRLDTSGNVLAVVNYNGTEATTTLGNFPTITGGPYYFRSYQIIFNDIYICFLIDKTLVYRYTKPTNQGSIIISQSLPVAFRMVNSGTVTTAQQMRVGTVNVSLLDYENEKPWQNVMAGAGGMAYQAQTGIAAAQTSNYSNSANPTAAVPTNTTAALGTGLGGQFWETNSLALTTDGIISSYQTNNSAVGGNKNLYITGVTIKSYIQTVLAGGPYVEQWVLAYGHTAVSLATTESATAKAPRRVPLGARAVVASAAVTTELTEISRQFTVPIVVYPGEFIATVVKKIGTVGTTGTIAHTITFDGYWE